ncbi:hypothetical protein GLAREA_07460 [Glarea lozoyensis ATCC 20868]|uniref:Uncharacterized protein n=1 Tax=Glarea lozoyensis (strain ATCC 20868 / MF5171) TaxID=1116229 RepID=S3D1C9_GLAL2|nr:uncharacterized protein GLAREA_07460 [Glarea lozoyensis ATCC 20868]EPE32327.1 hypothetical protein GLAREA_07460 [Glarea lozoyensis ATCC 20868]
MPPHKKRKLTHQSASPTSKFSPKKSHLKQTYTSLSAHHRLHAASLALPTRISALTTLIHHSSQHLLGHPNPSFTAKLCKNKVHFQPFRYNTTSSILALKHFVRHDLLAQGIITHATPPEPGYDISAMQVAKRVMAKLMGEDDPILSQKVLELDLDEKVEDQSGNVEVLIALWKAQPDVKTVFVNGIAKPARKRTPACFGQFQWSKCSTTVLQCDSIRKMWVRIHAVSTELVLRCKEEGPMSASAATRLLQTVHNVGHIVGFVTALDLAVTGLVRPPTRDELVDLYCARIFRRGTKEQMARIQWNSTLFVVAQLAGLRADGGWNRIDGSYEEIRGRIESGVEGVREVIARELGRQGERVGWEVVEHAVCKTGRWDGGGKTPRFYDGLERFVEEEVLDSEGDGEFVRSRYFETGEEGRKRKRRSEK